MKKIIAISLLVASLAGSSAFGQGYFSFSGGKSSAWDGFTTPNASTRTANITVAFLWAVGTPTPLVDTVTGLASVPTNTFNPGPFNVATAWTDILNDPSFHLATATNNGSLANGALITATTVANNGGWAFSGAVGVTGTSPSTTYTLFSIGWNAAFATPALAAAANAAVGWGTPFTYGAVDSLTVPATMPFTPFGTATAVPEPSTIALAGLGGLAALLFRRRK